MDNPKNQETNNAEHGSFHGVKTDAKVLKITGWLTGIYFVIELILGFYSVRLPSSPTLFILFPLSAEFS